MTTEEMISLFGDDEWGSVKAFYKFAFVPDDKIERLRTLVLDEDWGHRLYLLRKYLAINVRFAVEQGRFVLQGQQLIMAAGCLQTRYGAPVYLIFERNNRPDTSPWYLKWLGPEAVVEGVLPDAPSAGEWPTLRCDRELTVAHEHILEDHPERVQFLLQTPPVSQICAIAGAIQWALHRGLAIKQMYLGSKQYLVPVYLQSRENLGMTPDLVAPLQVGADRNIVRTLLLPHMAFPYARCVAERIDRLSPWLLDAWHNRPSDDAAPNGVADDHVAEMAEMAAR